MAIVTNSFSKDSRWLQLEVCREFQRNKCSRPDTECKFAHPASNVEVQSGRVVACYDSIKGRCNREKPPCKYFHPPQHLKDQLLTNGRNYLALKNLALQSQSQMSHLPVLGPAVVGIASSPVVSSSASSASSYLASAAAFAAASAATGPTRVHHLNRLQRRKECESRITGVPLANGAMPSSMASAAASYAALSRTNQATSSPYMTSLPAVNPASAAAAAAAYGTYPLALIPSLMSTADHLTNYGLMHAPTAALITAKTAGHMRTDRLEICREHQRGNCKRQEFDCRYAHVPEHVHVDADGLVTVCMDFLKGGGVPSGARTSAARGCTRDQCRYFHPPSHLQSQLKARSMPIVSMPSTVTAAAAAAAAANAANFTAAAVAAHHHQQANHHHHHHQMMSNAIPSSAETMSLIPVVPQHHLTLASSASRPNHPYRL